MRQVVRKDKIREATKKLLTSINSTVPILLGILLLLGLVRGFLPENFFADVFTGNLLIDPLIGAGVGSITCGNPMTGYVIGGELLEHGTSLIAVVAFIVSWVTIGIIQLPLECVMLGRRFAIARTAVSFVLSVCIAVTAVVVMEIIPW
jgi:uncharacterized membrane protein YraQ (UPF0718 family)